MDYLMVLVANFSFKVIRIASRVALRGQDVVPIDLKDAVSKLRTVDMRLYDIAKVFFG